MRTTPAAAAALMLAPALTLALTGCSGPLEAIDTLSGSLASPTVDEALAAQSATVRQQVSSPTIREDGVLTVGLLSSANAPLAISSQGGDLVGYDVDVAYALASELGLDVRFVTVSGTSAAQDGTCDVVMGVGSADAGSATVVGSYVEDATALFRKGTETTVSRADLAGKAVGVQAGSASEQTLERSDLEMDATSFDSLNDAFEALDEGKVDYVLCDSLVGGYLQGAYGDIALAGTVDVPSSLGVAVSPANTELQQVVQQAVDALSTNGVVGVVRGKWLGGMGALSASSQVGDVSLDVRSSAGSNDAAGVTGAQDGSTAGANAAFIS